MVPASPGNSEWLTRKVLIDRLLASAGWRVVPYAEGAGLSSWGSCAVEEYPTSTGPADYALIVDGRVVGIVEAKKLTLGPQNVLSQAERYSKGLSQAGFGWGGFGVPFLYSTNGEVNRAQ